MKAVILAAGEGKRMRPLTLTKPKPLLEINGKTLLDYIFEAFPSEIDSAVIVTKYLGGLIRDYCGSTFHGIPVSYTEGSELGTALSFVSTRSQIESEERFLFVYGDEFPDPRDIAACLQHESSILCFQVDDPWNHGVALVGEDGSISEIVEKPAKPQSNLIANGIMVLKKDIFKYAPVKGVNDEFSLTDMIGAYVQDVKTQAVLSVQSIGGISTPADIKRVSELLSSSHI